LNEKVKKSAYITGEHLEALLSCMKSLNIVYKNKKIVSVGILPKEMNISVPKFTDLIFIRTQHFEFEPY